MAALWRQHEGTSFARLGFTVRSSQVVAVMQKDLTFLTHSPQQRHAVFTSDFSGFQGAGVQVIGNNTVRAALLGASSKTVGESRWPLIHQEPLQRLFSFYFSAFFSEVIALVYGLACVY